MRLTLRTLLAYLDDTLPAEEARKIGIKVAEHEDVRELIDRIRKVIRKRGLATPTSGDASVSDPNTVAEYLSDALGSDAVAALESKCLESDVHLAEVAACHQLLTLLLSEPTRVPPTARKRMYELVKGPESLPNRKPGNSIPIGGMPPEATAPDTGERDVGLLLGMPPESKRGIRWVVAAASIIAGLLLLWFTWPRPEPLVIRLPKAPPVPAPVDLVKSGEVPLIPPGTPDRIPLKPEQPSPAKTDAPRETIPAPKAEPPEEPVQRQERSIVGSLKSTDRVVLTGSPDGSWARITAEDPRIATGDVLVALPGQQAELECLSNLKVQLWGNLPELLKTGAFESSVTFRTCDPGMAADLTLNTGRIYIQPRGTGDCLVRVRFRDQIWELRLMTPQTQIALELKQSLSPGFAAARGGIVSQASCHLIVIQGDVRIRDERTNKALSLTNGGGITWRSSVPEEVSAVNPARMREFTLPVPPSDPRLAEEASKCCSRFAANFGPRDSVRVRLAEEMRDLSEGGSRVAARMAVYGLAAIGDTTAVVESLLDPTQAHIREAAATALKYILAARPDADEEATMVLVEKARYTAEQAAEVILLLHGPGEADSASAAALNRLVDDLTADILPIRELAYRNLSTVVETDVNRYPNLFRYDPNSSAEDRQASQRLWRKRVEDLLKDRK